MPTTTDHSPRALDTAALDADLRERLGRLDTPAVHDALDSLAIRGVLPGVAARLPGLTAVGPAFTVRYRPLRDRGAGFRNAADYLDDVPAGAVIVVDNGGRLDCTNWGSLLTATASSRGVAGTVLHGSARDLREVTELRYPLFSTGVTMVSGKNRVELDATQVELDIAGTKVAPGDLVLADDNGALVIPRHALAEVLARAEAVDLTETRIRDAVATGSRLDAARAAYRYDRPWEATADTRSTESRDAAAH